jgi:ribosome-binding factor A
MRQELVMKPSRHWLDAAASLCDEIGPEDGLDPRRLSRALETKRQSHKTKQLCKAAQRTLSLSWGGAFGDPILQSLSITDVTPDEGGASLLISFSCKDDGTSSDTTRILAKLHAVQGLLRAAIARSVNRKRVPTLKFKRVRANSEVSSHACT